MSESVGAGDGRVELRQSTADRLALPILIAVALLAVVVSLVAFHSDTDPDPTVYLAVCAVAAVLDVLFAAYLLRNTGASLVVTPDAITFVRRKGPNVSIHRVDGSTLSFRVAANGPVGGDHTGYVLKLRENVTGREVYAGALGRRQVQQACESQGWSFGAASGDGAPARA